MLRFRSLALHKNNLIIYDFVGRWQNAEREFSEFKEFKEFSNVANLLKLPINNKKEPRKTLGSKLLSFSFSQNYVFEQNYYDNTHHEAVADNRSEE